MPIIAEVRDYLDELTTIRRDIHAHPELAFAERRTADLVAAKLAEFGLRSIAGLPATGVVGTIRRGNSPAAIGLRADMDALPIQELNDFAHRSTEDGKMHACGHDGHTTMLLGAAKYLATTRNFQGTVHLIFQPAEEGGGGGRVMVEEGLFDKFPCDAVFALHNKPGIADRADRGKIRARCSPPPTVGISGSKGTAPTPRIRISASTRLSSAPRSCWRLQTIVSRTVDPLDSAVVSIGFMRGGSAYNAIPDGLHIGGTARSFRPEVQDAIERRIGEIARGVARAHGATAEAVIAATIRRRSTMRPRPNSPPRSPPKSADRTQCHPRHRAVDGRRGFLVHAECSGRGRCCGSATARARATASCTMRVTTSTTTPCRSASASSRGSPNGFSKKPPLRLRAGARPRQPARQGQVRPVDHLAVEGDRAGIGVFGERRDDLARPGEFFVARREAAVDDRDLRRVDRHLGGEAGAPGGGAFGGKPGLVAEIGVDRVDRHRPRPPRPPAGIASAPADRHRHRRRRARRLLPPMQAARSSAPQVMPSSRGDTPA